MYLIVHIALLPLFFFFFFKQKTAYEMRISDWSSDVCSSDLAIEQPRKFQPPLVGDKRDMMPPRAQNLAQHIGGHHMAAGAAGRQHDMKRDRVHSFHPPT